MLKKATITLLILALIIILSACTSNSGSADASLYQKGLEIINRIDSYAENPNYVKSYSLSDDLISIVDEAGAEDYSQPKGVYKVAGIADAMATQYGMTLDSSIESVVKNKASLAVANLITALNGANYLAATSCLTASDAFNSTEAAEAVLYIYTYNGKYHGFVSFTPYDNNIVTSTASFVVSDALTNVNSADDLQAYFTESLDLSGITVTQVSE